MDAFKINWNDKMKKDMFVNKILNANKKYGKYHFSEYDVKTKKWGRWNIDPEDPRYNWTYESAEKYYDDNNGIILHWRFKGIEPQLFDNTAPHSLYNLRYASLR